MIDSTNVQSDQDYTFTVVRIRELQALLSCVDKKKVNVFINEIRSSVYAYHESKQKAVLDQKVKAFERFFVRLDDKAHQLARFTVELSDLVNQAPAELHDAAKNADRAIDNIHGKLVDLCLTIDKLSKQKVNFYQDAKTTVQDVYNSYSQTFRTIPNCRLFNQEQVFPADFNETDLLVPVLEILILEPPHRINKLLQSINQKLL